MFAIVAKYPPWLADIEGLEGPPRTPERSALTMEHVVRSVRLGAARKHTAAQRHASSSSGLLYQSLPSRSGKGTHEVGRRDVNQSSVEKARSKKW